MTATEVPDTSRDTAAGKAGMHLEVEIIPRVRPRTCQRDRYGRPAVNDRAVAVDGDTGAVPYDRTIYLGSAAHYRYGRPRTHQSSRPSWRSRRVSTGTSRLLDVGCGPGVLTVRLAHLFAHAVGLDPDADMLAEGSRAAREEESGTSGGSRAWPRTCRRSRQGRTGW